MNMNPITCPFCEKEYNHRKKTEYERHVILCELIASSNKSIDMEEDDMPSQLQLYKIIRELSVQNKKLYEKVANLEKLIQRGGVSLKKVDILERLNTQQKQPNDTYNEWVGSFNIIEDDVECLTTESITQVICSIVSRNVETTENPPVISSDLKKSIIYIYGIVDDANIVSPGSSPDQSAGGGFLSQSQSPQWTKMEGEQFMIMICMIYKCLLTTLQTKWRITHKKRYNFDEIYMKVLKKITDIKIDTHNDTNNRKVWQHLYMRVSRQV